MAIDKTCIVCNKPFKTNDTELETCSITCNAILEKGPYFLRPKDNPRRKDKRDLKPGEVPCEGCQTPIIPKDKYDTVCGMDCFNFVEFKNKHLKRFQRECIVCGQNFSPLDKEFTCSFKCKDASAQKRKRLAKEERRKDLNRFKEKKKRKAVDYCELNRRAELKRLDQEWQRLVR